MEAGDCILLILFFTNLNVKVLKKHNILKVKNSTFKGVKILLDYIFRVYNVLKKKVI